MHRKRYALAGTGARGGSFARAINREFTHCAELVGLFDRNRSRLQAFANLPGCQAPRYTDLDLLVREQRPDCLIICTPDDSHDQLIERAFAHGLDAIVEKPMATSLEKVRRVFELERRHQRRVRVAFNYRHATYCRHIKQTLLDHPIGDIRSVNLDWFLDQVHGTEYFRRWHAHLRRSGGLLVHKSTHHFDLINWLIEDVPVAVTALGSLRFFGRNGPFRGENCRRCAHREACRFCMPEPWEGLRELYYDAEHEDGYLRDACVFREDIDIYDTMTVAAEYARGAQLAYSLIAYAPCEGFRLSLTGTEGRLEAEEFHGGIMMRSLCPRSEIRIIRGSNRQNVNIERIALPVDRSDHGGGDRNLCRHLFEDGVPDPLRQMAGSYAGAASCLIGICANRSIETGQAEAIPLAELAPDEKWGGVAS